MWTFLHSLSRVTASVLGVAFIAMASLLYPGEEGKIQSVLEDTWRRLYKQQGVALSLHTAFMQEVAKASSQGFDRLLGHELLSPLSFSVSVCYSIASVGLFGIVVCLANLDVTNSAFLVSAVLFPSFLFLGTVPALFPNSRPSWTWFCTIVGVAVLLFTLLLLHLADINHQPEWHPVALLTRVTVPAVLVSLGSDVLFIALTRRSLRWAAQMNQFLRILAVIVVNCLLAACLFGLPLAWSLEEMPWAAMDLVLPGVPDSSMQFLEAIIVVSASNAIDALAASVFLLFAALLLVHRLFWPLLNRTLFRFKDLGTKGRRALLVAVGLALLTAAGLADWLKEIVKAFGVGA